MIKQGSSVGFRFLSNHDPQNSKHFTHLTRRILRLCSIMSLTHHVLFAGGQLPEAAAAQLHGDVQAEQEPRAGAEQSREQTQLERRVAVLTRPDRPPPSAKCYLLSRVAILRRRRTDGATCVCMSVCAETVRDGRLCQRPPYSVLYECLS